MENQDSDIPHHPLPPDECPITTLIGTRVTEMTDAELEIYTRDMRAVIDSPQELRKRMTFANIGGPKKERANKAKVDITKLLGL